MRLARFAGELGFTPTEETLKGATLYAENITQIVPERIYEELKKILVSDTKNSFSDKEGHYTGLKILQKTGVLGCILPELTLGENMPQRKDFHAYDVLEHTLKTVLYADKSIRLPALFHDIGKPYAYKTHGKFASHALDGEIIARETLNRLKAPVKIIEEVCLLTALHMVDFDLKMKRNKVKLFIARYHGIFDKLLLLKQADFSACKGDLSTAPTVIKWQEIYSEMIATNTPFTLKDLRINGDDLKKAGFIGEKIKIVLEEILTECIIFPERNERQWLLNSLKRRKND
jgi:tRNA nucleotidyltransferase/poly(A) polymerase